ncbi:MAG: SufE family protein [Pseudomonadota bacterium]
MAHPTLDQIKDDLAFLDDWEDRYKYVIDLGRDLDAFPADLKTAQYKVPGCVSQVWLETTVAGQGPSLTFRGDSDAMIVRGLIAILLAMYSGKTTGEIAAIDAEAELAALGLQDNLTPQRSNGLRSMVARIRQDAEAASASGRE